MGASRPWAQAVYRLAGVLAVLLVAALGVAVPPSMAVVSTGTAGFSVPAATPVDPARAAVPDAVSPRIAFTAARDAISTKLVTYGEGTDVAATTPSVPPVTPAPMHEGELSTNEAGDQAFVSTRDDPRGEVYVIVGGSPAAPSAPIRITCHNSAVESHPVISPDGTRLVYATNASGVFRLRLVMLDPNLAALGPNGGACPTTVYDLLGAPSGADTWPTWLSDQWVAFSSTSRDPLGDIWAQSVGSSAPPSPGRAAIRLTTGPAAETQPASIDLSVHLPGAPSVAPVTVLTFTTTQYRADGSIGAMHLLLSPSNLDSENPEEALTVVKELYSPWAGPGAPPQSSEGVWMDDGYNANLAFTTKDSDSYGDIVAVRVYADSIEDGDQATSELALPLPSGDSADVVDIADVPGRAESQPAWLVDDAETSGGSVRVSYTERTPTATVADVRAADGSGRRTAANESGDIGDGVTGPLDESTPAYSPDGTRLAYSRIGPGGQGREIVVARATGGAPVALNQSRPPLAFDAEPAWSPDGTRVAYVRTYVCSQACPVHGSKLWITEVATHTSRLVTADPAGTVAWDQHPSWSPDGTRLVIARALEAPPDLTASFAAKSLTVENGASVDVVLTVTNRGLGGANDVRISIPGAVGGGPFAVFVDSDPSCSGDDYYGQTCAVATIPAGSSQTWSVRVTGTLVGKGQLTIDPTVFGRPPETKTSNNAASIPVTVTKSATPVGPLPPPAPTTGAGVALAAAAPSPPQQAGEAGIREVFAEPPTGEPSTLWVLDAATGTGHQLSAAAPKSCSCVRTIEGRSPAWSPDGMRVAYEHYGSVRLIELADRRGGAIAVTKEVPQVQMVTGFTNEYQQEIGLAKTIGRPTPSRATISAAQDPAWSPDGEWIVLTGQPAGRADNPGVYRVRPTGTNLTVVAQEAGSETEPAWQPWASLAVTLTPSPASIGVGSQATLTATVTNPGPGTSSGTMLAMTLPAGLTLGTLPSGCVSTATATGSLITCTLGSIRTKAPTPPATGPVPATVTVRIPVTGTVLGLYTVTAAVGSPSPDDLASDNEASTSITVTPALPPPPSTPPPSIPLPSTPPPSTATPPAPTTDASVTVAMAPNPGYVGGAGTVTVVVANSASGTVTDATLTIILPTVTPALAPTSPTATGTPSATATATPSPSATPTATATPSATATATPPAASPPGAVQLVGTPECFTGVPCALGPVAPGRTRSFTATVGFATAGVSTITASVTTGAVADSDEANNSASVGLVVKQPVIRLLQQVADPGSVVMAVGRDFPPGAAVTLAWDVGVNVRAAPLTVAADGTIRATQILIFRRDQLGTRNLVATATKAGLFAPVQDSMMVAPRTVAPPADFASRS